MQYSRLDACLYTPYYHSTRDDGKALFESIPDGEYELEIWHPQQRNAYKQTLNVIGSTFFEVEIAVKPQLRSRRDSSGNGNSY